MGHASILFYFGFTQRPPHTHDRGPAHPAHQERSHRNKEEWNRRTVQSHHRHARRVLCPLRCERDFVHWIAMGLLPLRREDLQVRPLCDSGLCFSTTAIFGQFV